MMEMKNIEFEEALSYIDDKNIEQYNLKLAREKMDKVAADGFLIAQAYSFVLASIFKDEESQKKWYTEIALASPKMADELMLNFGNVDSDAWNIILGKIQKENLRKYLTIKYLMNKQDN